MSSTLGQSDTTNVIVAGSRHFTGEVYRAMVYPVIDAYLDTVEGPVTFYSGLAKGPDTFGLDYAKSNGHKCREFPADWDGLGKRAGMVRNMAMADADAHVLIAFWDLKSKGTKHMIEYARSKGIHVIVSILPIFEPSQQLEEKYLRLRFDKELPF